MCVCVRGGVLQFGPACRLGGAGREAGVCVAFTYKSTSAKDGYEEILWGWLTLKSAAGGGVCRAYPLRIPNLAVVPNVSHSHLVNGFNISRNTFLACCIPERCEI